MLFWYFSFYLCSYIVSGNLVSLFVLFSFCLIIYLAKITFFAILWDFRQEGTCRNSQSTNCKLTELSFNNEIILDRPWKKPFDDIILLMKGGPLSSACIFPWLHLFPMTSPVSYVSLVNLSSSIIVPAIYAPSMSNSLKFHFVCHDVSFWRKCPSVLLPTLLKPYLPFEMPTNVLFC